MDNVTGRAKTLACLSVMPDRPERRTDRRPKEPFAHLSDMLDLRTHLVYAKKCMCAHPPRRLLCIPYTPKARGGRVTKRNE